MRTTQDCCCNPLQSNAPPDRGFIFLLMPLISGLIRGRLIAAKFVILTSLQGNAELYFMLYLAGIVITFFLAVLLAGKQHKTAADRILIVWLCAIAFHLLLFYLFIAGKIYDYPALLGSHLPYPLVHGPLLFLYTAELTGQQPQKRIAWVIHFLPIIILYMVLIPFFSLPAAEKISIYRNKGTGYENIIMICFWTIIISGIGYVTASLVLLRRYRMSIENEFSNIEKINLAWLRYVVYGSAVIWTAVIIGNDTIIFEIVVLFVFVLGYFGIRQPGIFTLAHPKIIPAEEISIKSSEPVYTEPPPANDTNEPAPDIVSQKIKYEKSGLGEEQADKIYKQLVSCMTNQKIFSDSELTLAGLAKFLNVHPNHLSQVINSYEGKNFYDYINFHRVEEFKRLAPLPDNRNYTLLSLAYECGFNSKTSFNRNFKKATGTSPTEWLQRLNISLN